jgi:hypothetical protein
MVGGTAKPTLRARALHFAMPAASAETKGDGYEYDLNGIDYRAAV